MCPSSSSDQNKLCAIRLVQPQRTGTGLVQVSKVATHVPSTTVHLKPILSQVDDTEYIIRSVTFVSWHWRLVYEYKQDASVRGLYPGLSA